MARRWRRREETLGQMESREEKQREKRFEEIQKEWEARPEWYRQEFSKACKLEGAEMEQYLAALAGKIDELEAERQKIEAEDTTYNKQPQVLSDRYISEQAHELFEQLKQIRENESENREIDRRSRKFWQKGALGRLFCGIPTKENWNSQSDEEWARWYMWKHNMYYSEEARQRSKEAKERIDQLLDGFGNTNSARTMREWAMGAWGHDEIAKKAAQTGIECKNAPSMTWSDSKKSADWSELGTSLDLYRSLDRQIRGEYGQRKRAAKELQRAAKELRRQAREKLTEAAAAAHFGKTRDKADQIKPSLADQLEHYPRCPYCDGAIGEKPHADHIYPVKRGGLSTPENMVLVCANCNLKKQDKTLREFIRQTGLDRDRVERVLELLGKSC